MAVGRGDTYDGHNPTNPFSPMAQVPGDHDCDFKHPHETNPASEEREQKLDTERIS